MAHAAAGELVSFKRTALVSLTESARAAQERELEAQRQALAALGEAGEAAAAAAGALEQRLAEAGGALAQEGVEALGDVAGRVATVHLSTLREAVTALHDGDLPALAEALDSGIEGLADGHEAVAAMAAHAGPVEWARGVVETIHDLLGAMNLEM